MIVLGIDPGTATTGYGVLDQTGGRLAVVDYGVITTSSRTDSHHRLQHLHKRLTAIISDHRPVTMAVEQLFFNTNTTTAISVGQARGVALLAAADAGIDLGEYTPLQVKQAVTGYGRATKNQIQQMVKTMLSLDCVPKPDDAADALAVAICHINSYRLAGKLKAGTT